MNGYSHLFSKSEEVKYVSKGYRYWWLTPLSTRCAVVQFTALRASCIFGSCQPFHRCPSRSGSPPAGGIRGTRSHAEKGRMKLFFGGGRRRTITIRFAVKWCMRESRGCASVDPAESYYQARGRESEESYTNPMVYRPGEGGLSEK